MCDETFETLFAELSELSSDPEAFEEKRREILEANMIKMCNGCEEKLARCRAIQWRLDQELSKYVDPVARYNKMIEIFWKQVAQFQLSLNTIQGELEDEQLQVKSAEVLEFKNPNK